MNSLLPIICAIYEEKCTSHAKEKLKYWKFIIFHIFFIIIFFNSLYFDMTIKPSFKVQNIALINIKYNEKELTK